MNAKWVCVLTEGSYSDRWERGGKKKTFVVLRNEVTQTEEREKGSYLGWGERGQGKQTQKHLKSQEMKVSQTGGIKKLKFSVIYWYCNMKKYILVVDLYYNEIYLLCLLPVIRLMLPKILHR